MMDNWNESFFPFILYLLLIILVVVLIILILKLIRTVGKVDQVVEDVNYKVNKLNGLFEIIDYTTDTLVSFNDKIINFISNGITSFFKRKSRKKKKGEKENE
ncbi:MAG: hypothetical protein PHX03_04680 [Bacilli bacterium]|nr:hypothetical protein [Bacilli bacterium]MDD4718483.1 hypothetical protein [Bacilli bacterium]